MSKSIQLFIAVSFIFIVSCSKNDSPAVTLDCTTSKPTYTKDIASILNSSCAQAGCHSAASKSGGFNLSTFNGAKSAAGSSNFLKAIKHESGVTKMPEGASKLPDATIAKIECWVRNGTPE